MKFPIYDIQSYSWNLQKEHNVLFENPYTAILPRNFKDIISNFTYVDANGVLYSVVGYKVLPKEGFLSFLSPTRKVQLEFSENEEKYSIEEFKALIIKRAKETGDNELETKARNAATFGDILHPPPHLPQV